MSQTLLKEVYPMTHEERMTILKQQIEILRKRNDRLSASIADDYTAGGEIWRNAETIIALMREMFVN